MDEKKHAQFSGAPASISRDIGGSFTAYGGFIDGTNLELVPDKKITQHWRGSDWPKGHYSTARFEFEEIPEGTRLVFSQSAIPDGQEAHIAEGWKKNYWDKMKKMLEK